MSDTQPTFTRREALGGAVAALAAFTIVPRHVLGGPGQKPPSEKLNLAFIGTGGRARANLKMFEGENIAALCDVDLNRAAQSLKQYPNAKQYRDFRRMLDEIAGSIDGVVVSTPDHTHAVAAMAAIRRGKHVYCEKPLAHSIYEVRQLARAAREHKVMTQMGNQGHAWPSTRAFRDCIAAGSIGNVKTIHAFSGSRYGRISSLPRLKEQVPVPETLDWNLWLGPALERPYNPVYLPGRWRGWMPFGTGALGDWVCHVVDPVFLALDLGSPSSIQAQAKGYDVKEHADTFPNGTVIRYEFAAREKRGPVTMFWYDGEERPALPPEFEGKKQLPPIGAIVIGDKGMIMYSSHGANDAIVYSSETKSTRQLTGEPEWESPAHHQDWLEAVRTGKPAGSNFEYGGSLSEIALLGVIAIRQLGQTLQWDGKAGRFGNSAEADRLVNPPYRTGWTL